MKSLQPNPEVDFFCVAGRKGRIPDFIGIHSPPGLSKDPIRGFAEAKVAGFSLFADYKWIVWADPRMSLNTPALVQFVHSLRDHDTLIRFFANDVRKCIYEEGNRAFLLPLDRPGVLSRQMNRYHEAGMPARSGLAHTGFLIAAGGDKRIRDFARAWREELAVGSRCDLFSFEFTRWQRKERSEMMRGLWYRNRFVTAESTLDRPRPLAPLRFGCVGEWLRRMAKAEDLFSRVLYRESD